MIKRVCFIVFFSYYLKVKKKKLEHRVAGIIKRKQAEEALKDSEEFYRTILEYAFEGIAIVDGSITIND